LITGFWLALTALAAADGWLGYKRTEYADEAARLRDAMTGVERQRADVVFAAN
jgi:NADH:ubiquinone oxidoreductase subunit F (NADH-binding)